MSNLVKLDHKEFGIEESKAKQISEQFKPMLDKMVELEKEANEVFKLEINDPESSKKAKEVRLKYVKVRTGTDEIHKEQKAFYLQAGRFVDGWKNAQRFASQGIEEKLEAIEKHSANLEKERIAKLQETRLKLISEYIEDATGLDLGNMPGEVFEGFLNLKKTQKAEKLEAERIAEEKRIEEAKTEALRIETERLAELEKQKAIQAENDRLKKEQEAKDELRKTRSPLLQPYIVFIRDYNTLIDKPETEFIKELADIKKGAELQWQYEIDERNKKAKQEHEEANERAKEVEKATEIRLKKEAEENAENERLAKIESDKKEAEKLAKTPIKKQLSSWVDTFQNEIPENMKDDAVANEILTKFWAFKSWAKSEIEKI